MQVHLSPGNDKLGRICSVALPPIKTCIKNPPCADKCYAMQIYRQYPSFRKCCDENLDMYTTDRSAFFKSILEQFNAKKNRDLFRFQVAGDIVDLDYLIGMIKFAKLFPLTKITAYTKKFDLLKMVRTQDYPKNLSICLSLWPGQNEDISGLNTKIFPRVYMKDIAGVEKRIPKKAIECSGFCESCTECYNRGRKSIYIYQHGSGVHGTIAKMKRLNPDFKFGKATE